MPSLRQIDLSHDGRVLRGAFHAPERSLRGTVMLAHGLARSRTEPSRLLVDLARALQAEGFAVLAFDRAGHGESDGDLAEAAIPDEIDQLSAMLDYAQGPGPARVPVHMVGHGLGAAELAVLAARRPGDVASLHLWAPAGNIAETLRDGHVEGVPLAGTGPTDFRGQGLGGGFRAAGQGLDMLAGLNRITCPVSLHHGSEDAIVPVPVSELYLMAMPQALRRLYPLGDHDFSRLDQRRVLIASTVEAIADAAEARHAA
ncbi:alpha/beta hydrolase [Mangrovicoccus algicola]|uniref:Alpha/beta fold hydrolase n=1 Tax=Mangrovicoccus algicola TaxID=2771008 RepID=A0A8J6Z6M9_9RHOB|nr:alpha/beta fold hydrolase [Mangrovicoccus algicola]